ncbi:MAG: glutathione S-transferase family protein [Pontibacterium sp.]
MELIIGNKNYSSWSLRGWLMLSAFDIPFHETKLSLFTDAFYTELEKQGVAGKVPVLVDGDIRVWDSLAICEYVNETFLEGRGWPASRAGRAEARAIACEMHSGFMAVRSAMPMNCRARRKIEITEDVLTEIGRIDQIWSGLCNRHSDRGPWLFGGFSIADVMFAPVVLRFKTYGVEVSAVSQAYMDAVLSHASVQLWLKEALCETEVVAEDEAGVDV